MRCLTSWELVDVTGLLLPSCPLTGVEMQGEKVVFMSYNFKWPLFFWRSGSSLFIFQQACPPDERSSDKCLEMGLLILSTNN